MGQAQKTPIPHRRENLRARPERTSPRATSPGLAGDPKTTIDILQSVLADRTWSACCATRCTPCRDRHLQRGVKGNSRPHARKSRAPMMVAEGINQLGGSPISIPTI